MLRHKRRIAIIGAGQAGLQLGISLAQSRHLVSLYTDRTAKQIAEGRILSSQGMFETALKEERALGINFWDKESPQNTSITFSLATSDFRERGIYWQGIAKHQSIDQRLKFPRWMEEFEKLDGNLFVQSVGMKELDHIAQQHELTIVAGGKGEISQAFPIDTSRSRFSKPQRALSCLYVKDMAPAPLSLGVHVNIIPGVGEYSTIPGLTHTGKCEMMLFEGIPGGPLDCWDTISSTEEHLEKAKTILKKYVPWEAERCYHIRPTDEKATLLGRYTPVVRRPTFILPCGKAVLGLGDTIVLNDPVAGQGANHACKAASLYAKRILQQENKPFDEGWMRETAELSWNAYGKYSTLLTEALLMPLPLHVINFLNAASQSPTIANKLASGFDNPATLFPWLLHPQETQRILDEMRNGIEEETMKARFNL